MKSMIRKCLLMSIVLVCASVVFGEYPIKAVPFSDVKSGKSFWQMRIETNRVATIPHLLKKCEDTGRINNYRVTIGVVTGEFRGIYFNDSDLYKVIEGIGYSLNNAPDAGLEKFTDTIIRLISLSQQTNGYLNTFHVIKEPNKKWKNIRDKHELYCAGHFFEGAVAYYNATGKREILDTALRLADYICDEFAPGKRLDPPGHQGIEIGYVKLYKATGNKKYLDQAQFFLEQRGRHEKRRSYGKHFQDHTPVTNQFQAVGHAVRAMYMYSGMADVAAEINPKGYTNTLDRLWNDVVLKRLYITGGIGPGGGESFGKDYYLPNGRAYCETCASIALVFWNQRMFQMTGDGKYIDVLERTLYNALIDGVAIPGNRFFYPNPVSSNGRHQRSEFFACACCPVNIVRFIPTVHGYMYATKGDTLYVNLYGKSDMKTTLGGTQLEIRQDTKYPWNGTVKMTVTPAEKKEFTIAVRIPGWARNEPVPSDLYHYAKANDEKVTVSVNGTVVDGSLDKGYVKLRREWNPGDTITVDMPMPVRRVVSHPNVQANKERLALQRGPLVYCAEGPDNGTHVFDLYIPDTAELKGVWRPDMFNGIETIEGEVVLAYYPKDGTNIMEEAHKLVAIPYYAWAHRGRGNMSVWLARTIAAAKPELPPSIASTSKVTASNVNRRWRRMIRGINNQEEPESSEDFSSGAFAWFRQQGTKEWVQYEFATPTNVKSVAVYWLESDRGVGLPASWKILYKDGEEWKPVENTTPYTQELDTYNRVTFKPVHTPALKLEVQLPEDESSGVLEWKVE